MGRDIDLTDGGVAIFREDVANGVAAATLAAPADLTGGSGSYAMELLDALPAGVAFLTIDAAGKWATNAGGASTLDAAYDSGGPGAGRVITADSGPVEIAGPDGLRLNTTIPKIEFETDVGDFNYRISASAAANKLLFQRGSQDADISDDVFISIFSIDELRMVGINTENPQEALHVTVAADIDAKVRVQSPIGRDATVVFMEDGTARYELGYDDSAGGLVLGRLSFANPLVLVQDTTGTIRLGQTNTVETATVSIEKLDATVQQGVLFIRDEVGGAPLLSISKFQTSTTNHGLCVLNNLFVGNTAAILQIIDVGDGIALDIDTSAENWMADLRSTGATGAVGGVRVTKTGANGNPTLQIVDPGTAGGAVEILQQGNGLGLLIDSEATGRALLELQTVLANTRGDIKFPTVRTAFPTGPAEGDMFYDATLQRMGYRFDAFSRIFSSRYGPNLGLGSTLSTISAGVATATQAKLIVAAETGTVDTLTTLNSVPQATEGDVVRLQPDTGDTITVANSGNIRIDGGGSRVMNLNDKLWLMWDGALWLEITYSNLTA